LLQFGGALAVLAAIGAGVAIALGAGGAKHKPTTGTSRRGQPTTTTAARPTSTVIFNPVNSSGQLAVAVQHRPSGACFTGSENAQRSDAWRCTVDNVILDPCFATDQSHVLCPTDGPWGNKADLVSLPGGLPAGLADKDTGTSGQPWALQLADGSQCLLLGGATTVVAGQRLNYDCANGLALYGNVQRGRVWMIYTGTQHSAQLNLRPVASAWF
jgi:hypothetical protein